MRCAPASAGRSRRGRRCWVSPHPEHASSGCCARCSIRSGSFSRDDRMILLVLAASLVVQQPTAPAPPRARDLGVPFEGTPGPLNAITDVAGVEVGHSTLISGDGPHAVRTGVTVVLPKGKKWEPVFGGWFAGNGFGELTGTAWLK